MSYKTEKQSEKHPGNMIKNKDSDKLDILENPASAYDENTSLN
jgi:hypothetical protein